MKTSARLSQRLNAISENFEPVAPAVRPRYRVHVTRTGHERLEAARLVAKTYVHEGYIPQNSEDTEPFLSVHHLLKESTVFVVSDGARVMGTLAVILDSRAGLPMDELYSDEIEALRTSERRLCEICSLSVDPEIGRQSSSVVLNLFRMASHYAFYIAGVDDLCLTIKPSHARFYSRIACEVLGAFKLDPRFGNAETLAMRLRAETVRAVIEGEHSSVRKCRLTAREVWMLSSDESEQLKTEHAESAASSSEVLNAISNLPEILARATQDQIKYLWQTQDRRQAVVNYHTDNSARPAFEASPMLAATA